MKLLNGRIRDIMMTFTIRLDVLYEENLEKNLIRILEELIFEYEESKRPKNI